MSTNEFRVVIPARYESSRLPAKVLQPIAGKPMLQWVWERGQQSQATQVVIATDSHRVADVAADFGAEVCMTSADCRSGTDRVAEVCVQRSWGTDDLVVNLQGDAPLMPAASIDCVAQLLLEYPAAHMSTLCVAIAAKAAYEDLNVVKVVCDATGRAMYFSRSPLPAQGHDSPAPAWQLSRRHLGLYAYRVATLMQLQGAEPCALEQCEKLEQLRALWLGMEIRVAEVTQPHGPDVDTAEDLAQVEALLRAGS